MKAWCAHVVMTKLLPIGVEIKSTHSTVLAETRDEAAKQTIDSRFVTDFKARGFHVFDLQVSLIDPAIAPINNQEFSVLGDK